MGSISACCQQSELAGALHKNLDHKWRSLTVLGTRNKLREIDLEPFDGYALLADLPRHVRAPWLFWHDAGEPYRNLRRARE